MVLSNRSSGIQYTLAILMVGAAAILTRVLLAVYKDEISVVPLFFMAVAVSAWIGGIGPGLIATFTSFLAIAGLVYVIGDARGVDGAELLRIVCILPIALIISSLHGSKRKAQQELVERDLRLRLVSDQIPGGLWSTDDELRVTSGFGAQSAILHGPAGQTLYDHFKTREKSFAAISAHLLALSGESSKYELEWCGRVFQCYVEPLRDPQNAIIGVVGVATDITARIKSENERERLMREVETQRARLNAIIESIPAGVVVAEVPLGKIVMQNSKVEEILRHPFIESPDVHSYSKWGSYHADGKRVEGHEYPLARGLRGEVVRNVEYLYHRGDGTKGWIRVSGAPINDRHGNVVGSVAIFYDIDLAKRAEEEVLRAKQQLEVANKSKDQFLAMLSHELRTPLTPVLALTTSLLERDDLPAEIRENLEVVNRNVSLEATLIDDLLDLTRISRGKLQLQTQDLDAHDLVENAIAICAQDAQRKRITVELMMDAVSHFVHADPARLQQVLWNIIKNAVKFTPAGGRVAVRTMNNAEGKWCYEVRDSGIGIEPEMTTRIFDAFDQGSAGITRQFGGLGLGLAISKSLVEKHGGTIRVQSEGVGKGSCFTVELATVQQVDLPTENRAGDQTIEQPMLRILLVEDHPDTAKVMRKILSDCGHTVDVAIDVASALVYLKKQRVDLLVSDLGLPDGTGHDLMREVAETYAIRGIALSGYGTEADVQKSMSAGFAAHLTKPVLPRTLRNTIAQVTERRV